MASPLIAVKGSERAPIEGAKSLGLTSGLEPISATVILRRKTPISNDELFQGEALSREAHQKLYGATEEDAAAVKKFAESYDLTATVNLSKRTVDLAGTVADMSAAFGVTLNDVEVGNETYRERTGNVKIPLELQPVIEAVIGLDNRPVARPKLRWVPDVTSFAGAFTPLQVAKLYNFPAGTGAGQTVAIIELGGGFNEKKLATYFESEGIKPPPSVTAATVPGGSNTVGSDGDADAEVQLDIEVVGSIVPQAKIVVYFAANTDQSFLAAVSAAVHDTAAVPAAISISWGGPEANWPAQSQQAFESAFQDAASLGIVVTVASGDSGSSDGTKGLAVDFPGSAPHALCCGGTQLTATGSTITNEIVWNSEGGAGGGGHSSTFAMPTYQTGFVTPPAGTTGGRGVPDVSGNAAPNSGYIVSVDGKKQVIGGTSAVAPLYAALVTLCAEKLGKPVGFLQPQIYKAGAQGTAFHDITSGNNDASGAGGPYNATKGWDPASGLGSPNGMEILALL
jgi:kumamolisin